MPGNYYFKPDLDADRAIHPRAYTLASSLDREEIVARRRRNYQRLAGMLRGMKGANLLHDELPDGVCPLSFPLLASNRDGCVEAFQARGVGALPWWAGFHRSGIDWAQFPEACRLKRQMLTLPVHQNLDEEHLAHVAEAAVQVLQAGKGTQP
jgi:dTDP-4-amino-4,6-dideoxygalactose transaminase